MKFLVVVKHFQRVKPATHNRPEEIHYDYEDQFIFSYDGILRIQGTSWCKRCSVEEVADVINGYFKGTCYHITEICKL